MSQEAANKKSAVLAELNYDFTLLYKKFSSSPLAPGSEFRPPQVLEPLLSRHPLWPTVSEMLAEGLVLPLMYISSEDRQADLDIHRQRGNHKSAVENAATLKRLLLDDVIHGYSLPLSIDSLAHIKNASLAPLGCHEQKTIDEHGNIVPKWRMCHDQTFPGPSGLSLNLRTKQEELPPCMFGWTTLRMIHQILALRQRHPATPILIGKFDIKAAYRRAHLAPSMVTECLTVCDGILYAALRATFGGAAFPSLWSCHSEMICDLANDLLQCPEWDYKQLHSPLQHLLPAPDRNYPVDVAFAEALPLAVNVPVNDNGTVEDYIDDMPTVCLDLNEAPERCTAAVPLALHLAGRPVASAEPLDRQPLLAVSKAQGEGQMSEKKVAFGWLYNTRTLEISLPADKYIAWNRDLLEISEKATVETSLLDTTVGRLNHIGFILRAARHFMSRLRSLVRLGKLRNHKKLKLSEAQVADIKLFQSILTKCNQGLNLNLVSFRQPTHFFRSDASLAGLGGYSLSSGKAWQFQLPTGFERHLTLNTLEFLGCITTIWVELLAGRISPLSCVLSQTDSTSADGWLKKSNFCEFESPAQLVAARHLATLVINADICLYSQWFAGELNIVSDMLSRRFDLTPAALTSLIIAVAPEQVPAGFQICPLPSEIASWLTSVVQTKAGSQASPRILTAKAPEPGTAGTSTCPALASTETHSSTSCPVGSATAYSAPSSKPCATPDSAPTDSKFLLPEWSEPPFQMWLRPLGLTTGQTHAWMPTEKSHSFYSGNSKVIRRQTQAKSRSKPSQSKC